MIKRILPLLLVLVLTACANGTIANSIQTTQTPDQNGSNTTAQINVINGKMGIAIIPENPSTVIRSDGYPDIKEGFYLWGGTVNVTDIYRGWAGSAPVTIVNGNDYARTFHLSVQSPVTSKEYEPFPEKYYSWINIEDIQPKIAIGGSKKVSITLSTPYNFPSELKGNKYIFGILIEDWSQTGFIQLALRQIWLVSFAE